VELIEQIGVFAGLAAFLGLALLAMVAFSQARDIRRLREWAGSAPERDAERKDATSTVAAKRAEELRELDEARTTEREAVSEREERRRRREAGLPEQTRGERARGALAGFRSRLAEPLYLVAAFVAVLVLAAGGIYLATQGSDGGDGKRGGGKPRQAALKPGDIEVTVLNGTAVPGLAAQYGDMVESRGFQLGAVTNSSTSFVDSAVMFQRGNAPEARRVARALGISEVRLMSSDVASVSGGAPVSVIVGEDNAPAAG